MEIKSIKDYKEFDGIDINLRESLFFYGLIWRQLTPENYIFVYRILTENNNQIFCQSEFSISDFQDILSAGWFNIDDVLSSFGLTKEDWKSCSLPQKVSDLVCEYGTDNVFGTNSDNGFIIK